MRRRSWILALKLTLAAASSLAAGDERAARDEAAIAPLLQTLCAIARERNPDVQAALERVRQGLAVRRSADGFFDPVLSAESGYAERDPLLPALSRAFGWTADAVWIQAGIEQAIAPGWHGGLGAALRQRRDQDDGPEALAGAYVRIPLLQDRGFALQNALVESAEYDAAALACDALQTVLELERDLALRFTDHQLALAQREVAAAATERAERLLNDAGQMVGLGAIPAHQLNPARLEVARRREEEAAARRSVETSRRRLAELLGGDSLPPEAEAPTDVIAWAQTVRLPDMGSVSVAIGRRPDVQSAQARLRAAEARLKRARNERRSDLSAHVALAWGDDGGTESAEGAGWAVGFTWRKTFADRAGAAREADVLAQIAELRERARALEVAADADAAVARSEFEAALRRLELIGEAVETARAALSAENERFQLGEGTSRQTLDAQKDLTDVIRRRNDIAAELLRAFFRWAHAVGLGPVGGLRSQPEGSP